MSEPHDYLNEATYRPDWLKDGVTDASLSSILNQRAEIARLAKELSENDRFYLVGSGGSYSVQFPIRYIAEKYTETPVYQYSGWEFL